MTYGYSTIPLGTRGCDYAYKPSNWSYKQMWQAGNRYIGRYCPVPYKSSKVLTASERDAILDYGFSLLIFWETSAGSPLKGYDEGLSHGQYAAVAMAQLNMPKEVPICASFDFDVVKSNLALCRDYLGGFYRGLNGRYPLGIYGDSDIINEQTVSVCNVLPGASSWTAGDCNAHVKQYPSKSVSPGESGRYDPLKCLQPFTAWSKVTSKPPIRPVRDEDNVIVYALTDYTNTWSQQGIALTPEYFTALVNQGAQVVYAEPHDAFMKSILHISGLTASDLDPK